MANHQGEFNNAVAAHSGAGSVGRGVQAGDQATAWRRKVEAGIHPDSSDRPIIPHREVDPFSGTQLSLTPEQQSQNDNARSEESAFDKHMNAEGEYFEGKSALKARVVAGTYDPLASEGADRRGADGWREVLRGQNWVREDQPPSPMYPKGGVLHFGFRKHEKIAQRDPKVWQEVQDQAAEREANQPKPDPSQSFSDNIPTSSFTAPKQSAKDYKTALKERHPNPGMTVVSGGPAQEKTYRQIMQTARLHHQILDAHLGQYEESIDESHPQYERVVSARAALATSGFAMDKAEESYKAGKQDIGNADLRAATRGLLHVHSNLSSPDVKAALGGADVPINRDELSKNEAHADVELYVKNKPNLGSVNIGGINFDLNDAQFHQRAREMLRDVNSPDQSTRLKYKGITPKVWDKLRRATYGDASVGGDRWGDRKRSLQRDLDQTINLSDSEREERQRQIDAYDDSNPNSRVETMGPLASPGANGAPTSGRAGHEPRPGEPVDMSGAIISRSTKAAKATVGEDGYLVDAHTGQKSTLHYTMFGKIGHLPLEHAVGKSVNVFWNKEEVKQRDSHPDAPEPTPAAEPAPPREIRPEPTPEEIQKKREADAAEQEQRTLRRSGIRSGENAVLRAEMAVKSNVESKMAELLNSGRVPPHNGSPKIMEYHNKIRQGLYEMYAKRETSKLLGE